MIVGSLECVMKGGVDAVYSIAGETTGLAEAGGTLPFCFKASSSFLKSEAVA